MKMECAIGHWNLIGVIKAFIYVEFIQVYSSKKNNSFPKKNPFVCRVGSRASTPDQKCL